MLDVKEGAVTPPVLPAGTLVSDNMKLMFVAAVGGRS
jgi:hypothetical protein